MSICKRCSDVVALEFGERSPDALNLNDLDVCILYTRCVCLLNWSGISTCGSGMSTFTTRAIIPLKMTRLLYQLMILGEHG